MQNIDGFIDGLLQEKGTAGIDQDALEEIKSEMKTTLISQIEKAAVLKLEKDKLSELAGLMTSKDFTESNMLEFIKQAGVNLEEVAEATKQQFRNFYLNLPEEQ
jgi:predicted XRE-type DNA-binding protein